MSQLPSEQGPDTGSVGTGRRNKAERRREEETTGEREERKREEEKGREGQRSKRERERGRTNGIEGWIRKVKEERENGTEKGGIYEYMQSGNVKGERERNR